MRNKILPVIVLAALLALFPVPASADPDEEALEADLADAITAVNDAQELVDTTEARAAELQTQIDETQARFDELQTALDDYALYLHTEGDLQQTNAVLAAEDPQDLIDALTYTGFLGNERAALLADAGALLIQLEAEQAAHAAEVEDAAAALDAAEKAQEDLEEELDDLRAELAAGPGSDGGAPAADSGPGSGGSCTEDDPTTSGCLTPATLHVYNETKEAGFDRYVSCYRSGGGGEHPKGRACDFSANSSGFQDTDATGGDKDYGDRLAAWYVNNASTLGIEYVIWYRQFWSPGSGWRSYSGGGTPAGDHTNHVHVSVR